MVAEGIGTGPIHLFLMNQKNLQHYVPLIKTSASEADEARKQTCKVNITEDIAHVVKRSISAKVNETERKIKKRKEAQVQEVDKMVYKPTADVTKTLQKLVETHLWNCIS